MTERIHKLDPSISNKIAAGEVVERPAAVVKELVENALDAGASKITIEIKKAGKELIRITDNGSGIQPEDVGLAFERHATSKIQTVDDIYSVRSLGFRGEALASISAVSNMEVMTRRAGAEVGLKAILSGGRLLERTEVGAPTGTTMMVKDLFFNTPARLKFLKTDRAELNAISEIVNKLVLSNPKVSFRYLVDGKNIFATQGDGKLYSTIYAVYEKSMAKNLIAVSCEEQGVKITGFISNVHYTRGNRKNQVFFVNGRYIVSNVLMDSVNLAYKPLLPPGRFGACVLAIDLDPSRVDVNIHPAKTEIKFHQEGVLKQILYTKIREVLLSYDQTPAVKLSDDKLFRKVVMDEETKPVNTQEHAFVPGGVGSETRPASKPVVKEKNERPKPPIHAPGQAGKPTPTQNAVRHAGDVEQKAPRSSNAPARPERSATAPTGTAASSGERKPSAGSETLVKPQPARQIEKVEVARQVVARSASVPKKQNLNKGRFFGQNKVQEEPVNTYRLEDLLVREDAPGSAPQPEQHKVLERKAEVYEGLVHIGSLFNTYLLFEKDGRMYMIDQHAAHEKILFEQYMEAFRKGGLNTQILLAPMLVEADHATHRFALDHIKAFERFGFRVEDFGNTTLVIREVPMLFDRGGAEDLFRKLLDDLSVKGQLDDLADGRYDAIATKACKAAVKAHDALDKMEVSVLLDQLKELNDPYTCPHGRPIIVSVTRGEIERKFKRT